MHRTMYIAHPYPGEVWEHSRIAKIPGHSKIFPIGGAYFIPSYKTYLPNTGGPWKSVALVHKLNLSTLHRNRCLRPVCCVKTKTWYWIQEPYMTIYVFRHKYIRFTFHMIIYVYVGRKDCLETESLSMTNHHHTIKFVVVVTLNRDWQPTKPFIQATQHNQSPTQIQKHTDFLSLICWIVLSSMYT